MHTAMIILVSTGKIHLCLQQHDRCRLGHRNCVLQIIASSYTYPSWATEYFQGIRVYTWCCAWNVIPKKSRISDTDQHNMGTVSALWSQLLRRLTILLTTQATCYISTLKIVLHLLVFPLIQQLDFFLFWKVHPFENIKHWTTHTKLFPHVEF